MQFEPTTATGQNARSVASLEDYLEAVTNRKLLVVACFLLGIAGSMFLTRDRVFTYESSASVLLNPSPYGTTDGRLVDPNLEREAAVLVGEDTGKAVRTGLGLAESDPLDASVGSGYTPESDVITVKVTASDANRAAAVANQYVEAYVAARLAQQAEFYTVNIAALDAQIDDVEADILAGQTEVFTLEAQLQDLRNQEFSIDRDIQINTVATQRNSLFGQISSDQAVARNVEAAKTALERNRDGGKPAAVRLSTAFPSGSALGIPNRTYHIAGAVLGLLLGVVLAFLRERLDRRAQSSREVELALGTKVIGTIPKFSWRFRRGQWALVMANGKQSNSLTRTRESYRRLRSSLMFLARTTDARVVVLTSSKPLEGKSTTSANLATSLALGGARVVLINADLRRPSLERVFGVHDGRGLTSYLVGHTDTVHTERIPGVENLTLIPAGPQVDNPGELLGSDRFARLVATLREDFDLVIIDTPPLRAAADALAAAEVANGMIIVVDGNRTDTNELLAIRSELDRAGIPLLGAVMNRDASQKGSLLKRSGYGYYGTDRKRIASNALPTGFDESAPAVEPVEVDEAPAPAAERSAGHERATREANVHDTVAPADARSRRDSSSARRRVLEQERPAEVEADDAVTETPVDDLLGSDGVEPEPVVDDLPARTTRPSSKRRRT